MVVVLMGTTGAGKTTVGRLLAEELGWKFADADDFHSRANKAKMSEGLGLTDADREPWLGALRAQIEAWVAAGENAVLACSALKQAYRERLTVGPEVKWIYLRGRYDQIRQRLEQRRGHYAKTSLLASQFEALEEPAGAIVISIDRTPEQIRADIRQKLAIG